jgi:hypothetical protein
LVFRSIVWPDFDVDVPAGLQYGHRPARAEQKDLLWVAAIWNRRCSTWLCRLRFDVENIEVLIAQQQLNVAVVEQLHAARLAFYAALYNRRCSRFETNNYKN